VATLKCGGPPTMPEENRGPWSKKFENRCRIHCDLDSRPIHDLYDIQIN